MLYNTTLQLPSWSNHDNAEAVIIADGSHDQNELLNNQTDVKTIRVAIAAASAVTDRHLVAPATTLTTTTSLLVTV